MGRKKKTVSNAGDKVLFDGGASAEYETMLFRDLRRLAMERKVGESSWRITATKQQLIAALKAADAGPAASAPPPAPAAASAHAPAEPNATASPIPSLAALMAEHLAPYISASVSRDEVDKLISDKVAAATAGMTGGLQNVVVNVTSATGDVSTKNLGVQHAMFEPLLRICSMRLHTYLVGPMGGGKTSAAKYVAEALGLDHAQKSVGLQTTEMDLLGYRDANGKYVSTDLRRLYESGGVFLLDEVDAGNPQVLVVLNSLLANGECSFPDGMVKKHPDFILLAGANTYGLGGDRQYVGRCQLDAATLDRFVYMKWGYDTSIMAAMCGVSKDLMWSPDSDPIKLAPPSADGRQKLVEEYVRKCMDVARKIHEMGGAIRHSVSPRTLEFGCRMVRGGFSVNDAMDMCCWRGLDTITRNKLV